MSRRAAVAPQKQAQETRSGMGQGDSSSEGPGAILGALEPERIWHGLIPVRTRSRVNQREHYRLTAKRSQEEHSAVGWVMPRLSPAWPVVVVMTRIGPGTRPMDDDGLGTALKAIRDAVAERLGIDDGDRRIGWVPRQERGKVHGVRVEVFERARVEVRILPA